MDYATNYDVGERKRDEGINEDSIAISVFEQGHREGYRGKMVPVDGEGERAEGGHTTATDEAGDAEASEDDGNRERERGDESEAAETDEEVTEDEASASQESVAENIEQIEQSLEEPAESTETAQDDVKIFSPDETATLGDEDGDDTESDSETSDDTATGDVDDATEEEDDSSGQSSESDGSDTAVSGFGDDGSDTDTDGEANEEPKPAGSESDEDEDDENADNGSAKAGEDDAEANGDDPQADGGTRMRPANRSAAAFVLADGAGGHDAGDVASYIATTIVCENLANVAVRAARADPSPFDVDVVRRPEKPTPAELRGAIEDAIIAAHQAIIANAAQSGVGAYTTVVAGIVADGKLHYGWVGDSRAYLVNEQREELYRLTRDHAVVDEMAENGQLDEIEARVHPRGNQVTRALGGTGTEDPAEETVPVETETVPLYAEDALLVTSDGLIDAQTDAPQLHEEYVESDGDEAVAAKIREAIVTDDEIRDWILDADSLADAAATLVDRANDRGGKDNISTLLVRDETCPETPVDADLGLRDVAVSRPVEDRETVIVDRE